MSGETPLSMTTDKNKSDIHRRSRLLNILAISGIVVAGFFLAIMLFSPLGLPIFIATFIFVFLAHWISFLLNRMGRFLPAALILLGTLILGIGGVVLVGIGTNHIISSVIYYFLYPVLAAGMLLGARATFGVATLNLLYIFVIGFVAYQAQIPANDVLGNLIPVAVFCYLMALIAWLYGSSLEKALLRLTEQSEQLKAANTEILTFSHTLEDKVEERTEELRKFTSMIAHDLRTPLTAVRGYTELLQERSEDTFDSGEKRAINMISSNTEYMIRMTEDLLEISRLQAGGIHFEMQALSVESLIQEISLGFEERITAKQLELRISLAPELPPVRGDHGRLIQALNNLVGNAYHYTPSGTITIGAQPMDGFVEISVSDTGIGIPLKEQQQMFTHFFRGKHQVVQKRKGTGLGLTIARSIIKAHQGEIWVESEPGKGSIFRFTLPQAASG